jgi:hypothetical protein
MRDTLALALVRAELCRVHAIGHWRRLTVSGKLPRPISRTTVPAMSRIPFVRDRGGARSHLIGASDHSSPPD